MPAPAPSKVFGVHVNFRSRADQRGRVPVVPSYFLKPPSSVAGDGDPVVRPRGTELLAFEGEIAIVVGRRARGIAPEDGLAHVGWVAPANDFGVYDLRWADRGSNVLAKGQDGFTPIGAHVPLAEVDPDALILRTFVNGEVVQEGSSADLLFPFGLLVADLARLVTLEPGDVILTGTPAGSRPVEPGDLVEVELEGIGRLRNTIVEGEQLPAFGAQPRATPAVRAAAFGLPERRTVTLSEEAKTALRAVSTATLTTQLRRHGIRNTFMGGLRPARPDLRLVGYARTLRYVPLREDLAADETEGLDAQKRAVESIGPEDVLVIDARGEAGAGTIGDILAARVLARGGAGIVTDGGVRDSPSFAQLGLPTYYRAPHANVLGLLHHPLETDVTIACGGTVVRPGDVIVGDAEGVLVLPASLAEQVARDALEQETREAWALERVRSGESIVGVYPLGEERRADYEAWRDARAPDPGDGA